MRTMKQTLSLFLAIALILPCLVLGTHAADTASGTCGENLTWTLDSEGTMTISGKGVMADYDYLGEDVPWRALRNDIKSLVVESGVTRIGYFAFYGCENLRFVSLPDGLTGIGSSAFEGCTSLNNVVIPDSVTDLVSFAFANCTSLTSIELPEGITDLIWNTFSDCTSLTSVTIPASLTEIWLGAFSGCTSLTEFIIDENNDTFVYVDGFLYANNMTELDFVSPSLVPSQVTIPDHVTKLEGYAFSHCANMTAVTIPDNGIRIGQGAFYYCTGLTGIVIPGSANSIPSNCFIGCANLSEVILEEGITSIEGAAFNGCTSLESFVMPASLTYLGMWQFRNSSLREIYFTGNAPTLEFGQTFTDCTVTAYFPASNKTWTLEYLSADNEGDITWLPTGTAGEFIEWLIDQFGNLHIFGTSASSAYSPRTAISCVMDDYTCAEETPWYEYRDMITGVVVAGNVSYVGNYAFAGCSNLTDVTIEAGVADLGDHIFAGCTSLETVVFEGDAPGITGATFANTEASIRYPEGNSTWTEDVRQNCGSTVTWVPTPSVCLGDADGSGDIDNVDAMLILQYAVGLIDETRLNVSVCDVSGGDGIDNVDAMLVLQYAVGLITSFPAEK